MVLYKPKKDDCLCGMPWKEARERREKNESIKRNGKVYLAKIHVWASEHVKMRNTKVEN